MRKRGPIQFMSVAVHEDEEERIRAFANRHFSGNLSRMVRAGLNLLALVLEEKELFNPRNRDVEEEIQTFAKIREIAEKLR